MTTTSTSRRADSTDVRTDVLTYGPRPEAKAVSRACCVYHDSGFFRELVCHQSIVAYHSCLVDNVHACMIADIADHHSHVLKQDDTRGLTTGEKSSNWQELYLEPSEGIENNKNRLGPQSHDDGCDPSWCVAIPIESVSQESIDTIYTFTFSRTNVSCLYYNSTCIFLRYRYYIFDESVAAT